MHLYPKAGDHAIDPEGQPQDWPSATPRTVSGGLANQQRPLPAWRQRRCHEVKTPTAEGVKLSLLERSFWTQDLRHHHSVLTCQNATSCYYQSKHVQIYSSGFRVVYVRDRIGHKRDRREHGMDDGYSVKAWESKAILTAAQWSVCMFLDVCSLEWLKNLKM